mgnify:FL=1
MHISIQQVDAHVPTYKKRAPSDSFFILVCGERGIRSYQRTELSNSQIIKGLSYISKYCSFVEDTHTYTNDAQKYKKYMKAPNFMTDFFYLFLRHIFSSRTISCVQYSLLAQYTKRDPILCLSVQPLLS